MSTPEPPANPELLRSFLASNDAACPDCGYNLRGATSAHCPECGHGLALSVRTPDRLGRRFGLLILLFAWLLLAGSMNSYRTGRSIVQSARGRPQFTMMNFLTPSVPAAPQPALAPPTTLEEPFGEEEAFEVDVDVASAPVPEPSDDSFSPADLEEVASFMFPAQVTTLDTTRLAVDATNRITARGQVRLVTTPAPGWRFQNVSWKLWASAGWWAGLSVLSAAALAVLLIARARLSERLTTMLIAAAWVSFAGYFLYHGVTFMREVL